MTNIEKAKNLIVSLEDLVTLNEEIREVFKKIKLNIEGIEAQIPSEDDKNSTIEFIKNFHEATLNWVLLKKTFDSEMFKKSSKYIEELQSKDKTND